MGDVLVASFAASASELSYVLGLSAPRDTVDATGFQTPSPDKPCKSTLSMARVSPWADHLRSCTGSILAGPTGSIVDVTRLHLEPARDRQRHRHLRPRRVDPCVRIRARIRHTISTSLPRSLTTPRTMTSGALPARTSISMSLVRARGSDFGGTRLRRSSSTCSANTRPWRRRCCPTARSRKVTQPSSAFAGTSSKTSA